MERKIVLVTGAVSGIGEACARKFAAEGYDVIINCRKPEKGEALKAELAALGADALVLPFDVRYRDQIITALGSLEGKWKNIDVLINNAGLVFGVDKEFEGNLDEWDIMIDTNIRGLLSMTRLVVPGMVERGRGHIINLGSIAGDAAYPGGSGVLRHQGSSQSPLRRPPHRPRGHPLRVTNIKPGLVETNFSVVRFRGDKAKADNVYKGIQPLTGKDIAEVAWFAASAPEYMQIAEVLVMPTNQATGTITYKKNS